ncbi:DUF4328 domain-containing protein [Streptomyces sp. NPDC057616]|uniref:DUF4328 domain-containing protein n=1 Tax=Streptomyces sp. NPDC057616 TaxID=3346183 RepID=UPI00368960A7
MLAAYAVLTVAAGVAAWHKYQVLLAPPLPARPDGSEALPLLDADMWFENLRGCWNGATLVTILVFSVWMSRMRDLAELVRPEGQRRSRAWLFFGWVVPVADVFARRTRRPRRCGRSWRAMPSTSAPPSCPPSSSGSSAAGRRGPRR